MNLTTDYLSQKQCLKGAILQMPLVNMTLKNLNAQQINKYRFNIVSPDLHRGDIFLAV